tara:strand:- start:76 stop:687 length:612 start_codon:yes stop_codon:yes gene_type:complete
VIERFDMPELKDSFIGAWVMPEPIIDSIWDYWQSEKDKRFKGEVASGKPELKKSTDLEISAYDETPIWLNYRKQLQLCLDDYFVQHESANDVAKFNIYRDYLIQFYKKGEGFFPWHSENPGTIKTCDRSLVFMTYCNNVPNGGTHFKNQKLTTPAIKGLTLIWPPWWTHAHKGQISEEHEKMIVTGWYSYENIFRNILKNDYI